MKSKLEVAEQTLASKLALLNKLQEQFQALERSKEALNEELSSAKASAEGQELKNTELVDEIQRLTEALQSKAEALDSLSSELK
ncbi:hypothetical protein, partial [Legionella jamestowniensis]|uniref:hypothetical protein n=1 Tax=Legionella jamestowniensis TaxID=455 RepID=UPI0011462034